MESTKPSVRLAQIAAWPVVLACFGLAQAADSPAKPRPAPTAPAPTGTATTASATAASTASPSGEPTRISADRIEALVLQVDQASGLSPEAKNQTREEFRQCLVELRAAEEWRAKAAGFERAAQQAPQELEALRSRIAVEAEASPAFSADASLESLKQSLTEIEARRKAARDEQADLENKQRRRADRREEIPKLDEAVRKRLEDLERKRSEAAELTDENQMLGQARRMLLYTRRLAAAAEREAYAQELPSYEATRELLRAKLDDAVRRVNLAEKQAAACKEAIERRTQVEADAKARAAQLDLVTTRPELLPLAQENELLTKLRGAADGPAAKLREVGRNAAQAKRKLDRLKAEFARMKQVAGLSDELGQLLLDQRRNLPDTRDAIDAASLRSEEIARTKLALLDLEGRRSALADVDAETEAMLAPLTGIGDVRRDLERAVRGLLVARRGYLDDLIADYNAYLNALVLDLDKTERELLETVRAYQAYIDEQILWVRSFPPQTGLNLRDFASATARLADPRSWSALGGRLLADMRDSPQTWFVAALAFALLVRHLRRLRLQVARLGDEALSLRTTSMLSTLKVAALTAVLAAPAPTVLWFLATRLTAWPGADDFTRAAAGAFSVGVPVWGMIALARQALRYNGLATAHFGVSQEAADRVRRRLWRLAAVGLPATGIAAFFNELDVVAWQASLGRAAFVVGMSCLCRTAHVVLHPTDGLFPCGGYDCDEFRNRLRRLWYLGAVLVPLGPAALSGAGFHYAALQLAARMEGTLWLVLACASARGLALRWLRVARRRLAVEQVRRQAGRAAASASAPVATRLTADADGCLTLSAMDAQTRRMLNGLSATVLLVGAWWIWADLMPAIKFLDHWHWYSYAVTTAESVPQEDGPAKIVEVRRLETITAGDIVWAGLILLMTFVAARNLPGMLEISCLQWLPLDQGARYAATTIARYLIHVVGVVGICNAVGLQWSSIQWLAAAITVGLGFGLQEIFANFISGLIILFERPIRVGDTVTIGDVSGTVSRIRGRATTIVDWDRKELIVPNKEFITGKLVNWTLTDDVLRTVVRVGLCETADVARAAELLLEIARANPLVLAEPEPTVAFTQVGDAHLDFELRVFSGGLHTLTPLRNELNAAIVRAFREAGIELALRSREALLRMRDAELAASSPASGRQAA